MVESTALEMRRARKGTVGSNPTLSANSQFSAVRTRPRQGAIIPNIARVYSSLSSPIVRLRTLPFARIIRGLIRGLAKWVARRKA